MKKKKEKIPRNLDECFIHLDKVDDIDDVVAEKDENDFAAFCHFSLGMWIRNEWGLWDDKKNGELRQYFLENGVHQPDDMSGIILKSYHRYKKEVDLQLNEQIEHCIEYYMSDEEKAQYRRKKKLDKLNE